MEIKMKKIKMEKQGRVFIPKKIRERLGLRTGEGLMIEESGDGIILKPIKSMQSVSELRGCVKKSRIKPLELKKMWEA